MVGEDAVAALTGEYAGDAGGGAATGWLDAAGVIVEEGDEAAGGIDGTERRPPSENGRLLKKSPFSLRAVPLIKASHHASQRIRPLRHHGDLGRELPDLIHDLRERGGVAVGEQADAAGEGLGDAVEFVLDGGG